LVGHISGIACSRRNSARYLMIRADDGRIAQLRLAVPELTTLATSLLRYQPKPKTGPGNSKTEIHKHLQLRSPPSTLQIGDSLVAGTEIVRFTRSRPAIANSLLNAVSQKTEKSRVHHVDNAWRHSRRLSPPPMSPPKHNTAPRRGSYPSSLFHRTLSVFPVC
jgi:hypothetical protein